MPDEGGPAILIAHSYGGMVASQAGEHPAVEHLVYISSFLPAVGESLAALSSDATSPVPVTPHADGSVSVNHDDTAAFDSRFLHDVEDSTLVRGAHDRLCALERGRCTPLAVPAPAREPVRRLYLSTQ